MIKQTWSITSEEKLRILKLHESATKNLYLQSEQYLTGVKPDYESEMTDEGKVNVLPTPSYSAFTFCGSIVFNRGGTYFYKSGDGMVQIPKLSQLKGTLVEKGTDIEFDDLTVAGMRLGNYLFNTPDNDCFKEYPYAYANYKSFIVFFDDIEYNVPRFGVVDWKGQMRGYSGDMMDVKRKKDKDGVEIIFGKTASKSFIISIIADYRGKPKIEKPGGEPVITPIPPKEVPVELNLTSPFNFDDVTLTTSAEKEFESFINQIKQTYKNITGDVEVITSSSIDGNPNEKIVGSYADCKNSGTRKEYNFCLSQKRADTIIQRLKESLVDTKLNFIPKPIGETEQFDVGKKWPEVRKPSETSQNRRLIIKLPQIKMTVE